MSRNVELGDEPDDGLVGAPPEQESLPKTFNTHRRYRVGTILCLVLVLVFGWELRYLLVPGLTQTENEIGTLLFLLLAVALLLRNGWMMMNRVELQFDAVVVQRPLLAPVRVTFRQLAGVYEEGRGLKAILLAYHPQQADGLYDLDTISTVALPAVQDHDALYAMLAENNPDLGPTASSAKW